MSEWDADIEALGLSAIEKNGLQVYRNYTKAFKRMNERNFSSQIDELEDDWTDLDACLSYIASEDLRFVPVIACAYAEQQIKSMFLSNLPSGGPGGKKSLFRNNGPLSSLFNCIQSAYFFDFMSKELLLALDALRGIRNHVSHSWNYEELKNRFSQIPDPIHSIEDMLTERAEFSEIALDQLSIEAKFRIRIIWMIARVAYETKYYFKARQERLSPYSALYGEHSPKALKRVAASAMKLTWIIIEAEQLGLNQPMDKE